MNRSGKKCVLYPRVSTEMQVDGFSLDGQKNSLKRFADREEMEIVNIYEDAGKSGKSIEGRPAFKQMLGDIENGLEIDYILVYKLSRFRHPISESNLNCSGKVGRTSSSLSCSSAFPNPWTTIIPLPLGEKFGTNIINCSSS